MFIFSTFFLNTRYFSEIFLNKEYANLQNFIFLKTQFTKFQHKMPKKLGLLPSVAYSVGGIIGSGIFVAPTSVLLHSGSAGLSLCLWVIGGIVCAIGALVYVELGSCIPETGGGFAYQTRAGW